MVRAWRAISRSQDLEVIEVDRPNRQQRRRTGKSDTVDAVEAGRAALSLTFRWVEVGQGDLDTQVDGITLTR